MNQQNFVDATIRNIQESYESTRLIWKQAKVIYQHSFHIYQKCDTL